MSYRNVEICSSVSELPVLVHENSIAIVNGDPLSVYIVEAGAWVQKKMGITMEDVYSVDRVYSSISEKDPKDILGFGEWEMIAKEPCYMWKRVS